MHELTMDSYFTYILGTHEWGLLNLAELEWPGSEATLIASSGKSNALYPYLVPVLFLWARS